MSLCAIETISTYSVWRFICKDIQIKKISFPKIVGESLEHVANKELVPGRNFWQFLLSH